MEDAVDVAERLWTEGRRQNDIGQFAHAAETLDAARTLLADRADAAAQRIAIRIDTTSALTDLELSGYPAAAARLAAATDAARRLDAPDLVALTHIQHGVIDARSGLWKAAGEQLRQVVALFDHIGPVEQCSTLITLGLAELSLCRVDEARSTLEGARKIASERQLPVHLFKATHNLGCAAYIAGDLPEALRLMVAADEMPVEVARERAQLDLGAVLLEAGLVDQARETLTVALGAARESGQRMDEGDILISLARCALLDGLSDHARELAAQAYEVFELLAAEERREAAALLIAGIDVRDGVNLERALEASFRWSGVQSDANADVVDAALVRAEARLSLGELAACDRELKQVSSSGVGLLSRRLHELHVRARLADRRGDGAAFSDAVTESSRLCASTQGTMRSLEVRAALAQHVAPTAALDLRRALVTRSGERVFATIERWRAASQRSLAPSAPAGAELSELLGRLRWLRSGVAPVAELDPAACAQEIVALERAISLATWQQEPSGGELDQPIGIDELARELPMQTGYVAFASTNERCHAIVVGPAGELLVELGEATPLREAVRALRRDLRGAAFAYTRTDLRDQLRGAVAKSADRLSGLIIGPLAAALGGAEQLIIAPNDLLHAVPWLALPGVQGRPVTVAPSATVWARLSRDAVVEARTAGVVAGPNVRRGVPEAVEIARIWNAAGVATESGELPSSTAETAHALAIADIVHVAAHGHHAEDNPLFSSLLMADGPLFAHELVNGVRARHVVLSACDVGRSRIRAGGEALGLTAALLALGVQTVVAAVAPIPDEVSAAAAVAYHRNLARGHEAARALAEAIAATPGSEALCCVGGRLVVARP